LKKFIFQISEILYEAKSLAQKYQREGQFFGPMWENIGKWIFLGRFRLSSKFYIFPEEIRYNFAQIIPRIFIIEVSTFNPSLLPYKYPDGRATQRASKKETDRSHPADEGQAQKPSSSLSFPPSSLLPLSLPSTSLTYPFSVSLTHQASALLPGPRIQQDHYFSSSSNSYAREVWWVDYIV
jgi:hypothetical protein